MVVLLKMEAVDSCETSDEVENTEAKSAALDLDLNLRSDGPGNSTSLCTWNDHKMRLAAAEAAAANKCETSDFVDNTEPVHLLAASQASQQPNSEPFSDSAIVNLHSDALLLSRTY